MTVLRQMIDLLSRRERVQLGLLFVAMLVSAFLEMVSVASVLPFLSVAADPGRIHSNEWLSWAYDVFGFASTNGFLLALAGAALMALVLSNTWMAATHWAQIRFVRGQSYALGVRLLRHYLAHSYVFFLGRNSADLGKNVLSEVEQVTRGVFLPVVRIGAKTVVMFAIIALLVVFDPILAVLVAGVLGGAYGAISLRARRKLTRLGKEQVNVNGARFKAVSQAFGAIKDAKLLGKEDTLVAQFMDPSKRFNACAATVQIISEIPRFVLETLAFAVILLIAIYFIIRGHELKETIPVLGLYAFAGYRLMPCLQQVFSNYARLRFGAPALAHINHELTRLPADSTSVNTPVIRPSKGSQSQLLLPLRRKLELDALAFTYPGADKPALHDVSLEIQANSTIGIMGQTGSGKTTLVDIILGLLRPQAGEIRVDGVPLTDGNLRAWQNGLGYVPQHIYLSDDTVARNIAFGIPDAEIDQDAVERAARMANIHRFVTGELPEGYGTMVGERGIRLSGGQRQRIGIARALYHDPSVLVLDEATSALDNDTEAAVMDAINELAGRRTILIVAHRLTTLRACDAAIRIGNGTLQHDVEAGGIAGLMPAQSHVA